MERQPCVYILTNERNGTLYVGVTSNLLARTYQHKDKLVDGFSNQYGLNKLVWYEAHDCMESAIRREKAIKKWERKWKLEIIESLNPEWKDLYKEIL